MIIQRRKFLIGLSSAIAAPAIVRAQNIMPVKALPIDIKNYSVRFITEYYRNLPIHTFDILYGAMLCKPEWTLTFPHEH